MRILKKKRKLCMPNIGQQKSAEYYDQIKDILSTAMKQLVTLGEKQGFFKSAFDAEVAKTETVEYSDIIVTDSVKQAKQNDRNKAAKDASSVIGAGSTLAELVESATSLHHTLIACEAEDLLVVSSPANTLIDYCDKNPTLVNWFGMKFLIPATCSFLMSDVSRIDPLFGLKYDCIVIDPPWENKSVKRSKKYKTLPDWELYKLPIAKLAVANCLILVWVTNKYRQMEFVKKNLFPFWGVEFEATWHWLKVTTMGSPVFDMDSVQKKPYEHIIIGRAKENFVQKPENDHPVENECKSEGTHTSTLRECNVIDDHCVIISVPCSIHSRKPPLCDILKEYLPKNSRCLEMFARNLTPGWTSWGNEVLKFQHTDHFTRSPASVSTSATSIECSHCAKASSS